MAMICKILCKLGWHNWRPAGSVCVYGDGKWVGPFMIFNHRLIKVRRFYECRRCNERKEEISDAK